MNVSTAIGVIAPAIGIIKDVVLTVGAGVGIYVALRGLSTWRRQLLGNAEYELARRILRSTYKLRDAIESARNPAIFAAEIQKAREEFTIEKAGIHHEMDSDTSAVYALRWNSVSRARSELQVEQLEAVVLWGKNVATFFDSIDQCVLEMRQAIVQFISKTGPSQQRTKFEIERWAEVQKIVYPSGDMDSVDQFAERLLNAVKSIEQLARPHLER